MINFVDSKGELLASISLVAFENSPASIGTEIVGSEFRRVMAVFSGIDPAVAKFVVRYPRLGCRAFEVNVGSQEELVAVLPAERQA